MAPLSEFEKQRQANIARNKLLLQKLNLNSISNEIYTEIKSESTPIPKSTRGRKRKVQAKKVEPVVPTRRSRRIAGEQVGGTDEEKKLAVELETLRKKREELERLKNVRLSGDIKLVDVLTDKSGVKIDMEDDDLMLDRFNKIGKSISMGDFYETIVKKTEINDENITNLRESLSNLQLYPDFNPLDIKITPNRMTSILFHPSIDKRLVLGGDTLGYLGLWSIDDKKEVDGELEPEISIMKIHGMTIAKIAMNTQDPFKMYTCSYDGSIRSIDMKTLKTDQVHTLDDKYGDALGVSDINFSHQDPNLCYFSSLAGHVGIKDLRIGGSGQDLLRCQDKKIGSFLINPNFDKQIVTASLERMLRIWDLRNIGKATYSYYNSEDDAPHLIGSYSSRLSISCADWNSSGDILCNGYDDTINIFNLGDTTKLASDFQYPIITTIPDPHIDQDVHLQPQHKIRHNCQTGRWVSILKSKWQLKGKDGIEKFAIANMNRYFDIYTASGVQVGHLGDRDLVGAVPALVAMHPTENWVVGGSASGKGYLYID